MTNGWNPCSRYLTAAELYAGTASRLATDLYSPVRQVIVLPAIRHHRIPLRPLSPICITASILLTLHNLLQAAPSSGKSPGRQLHKRFKSSRKHADELSDTSFTADQLLRCSNARSQGTDRDIQITMKDNIRLLVTFGFIAILALMFSLAAMSLGQLHCHQ